MANATQFQAGGMTLSVKDASARQSIADIKSAVMQRHTEFYINKYIYSVNGSLQNLDGWLCTKSKFLCKPNQAFTLYMGNDNSFVRQIGVVVYNANGTVIAGRTIYGRFIDTSAVLQGLPNATYIAINVDVSDSYPVLTESDVATWYIEEQSVGTYYAKEFTSGLRNDFIINQYWDTTTGRPESFNGWLCTGFHPLSINRTYSLHSTHKDDCVRSYIIAYDSNYALLGNYNVSGNRIDSTGIMRKYPNARYFVLDFNVSVRYPVLTENNVENWYVEERLFGENGISAETGNDFIINQYWDTSTGEAYPFNGWLCTQKFPVHENLVFELINNDEADIARCSVILYNKSGSYLFGISFDGGRIDTSEYVKQYPNAVYMALNFSVAGSIPELSPSDIVGWYVLPSYAGNEQEDEVLPTHEISILFVGNSLTQDGIAYLPYLLRHYYPEISFNFYMWYNGGYTLEQQYEKFENDQACEIFSVARNTSSWSNGSAKMSAILSTYHIDVVCMQDYFNYQDGYTQESDLAGWTSCQQYITENYSGGNGLEFVTLAHAPKRDIASTVFDRVMTSMAYTLNHTIAQGMIPNGIAIYRAMSTDLDALGDQGHLSPDGTHAQEGLPCLLQTYVSACWLFDKLGIEKSVYGCPLRITTAIYNSINVPGPNLGTGVITGTDAENLLAQEVAIDAFKEGKQFVIANTLVSKSDIENNLTTTLPGKVLDARQGKALKEYIDTKTVPISYNITNLLTPPYDHAYMLSKVGNIVVFAIDALWSSSLQVGTWNDIATIPATLLSGLTKNITWTSLMASATDGNVVGMARCTIDKTTGKIRVRPSLAVSEAVGINGNLSWVVSA